MLKEIWNNYAIIKKRKPKYIDIITLSGENFRAKFHEIVKPFITDETIMLDAGCGIADHLIKYSRKAKKIYGVDFNQILINQAKENTTDYSEIEIILMDIRDLSFGDNSFDLVTSVYNPQTLKSTKEIYRVLKKGGYYIRTSGVGDFVRYNGRLLTRPQDIVKRGAFFHNIEGEVLTQEVSLIREAGFLLLEQDIQIFTGIKIFETIEDFILHVTDSGHFFFSKPYTALNENEINLLYEHENQFVIQYKNSKKFGLPFDLFLTISQKL